MDVLSLLRSKNRCLQKFLQASIDFLESADHSGQLPDLVEFESSREAILKAIDLYDRKVSEAVSLLDSDTSSEPERQKFISEVKAALDEKSDLVYRILKTDDRILSLIEEEKNKVFKELSSVQKQEEIARKFKSTWVPESGEGLDEKL